MFRLFNGLHSETLKVAVKKTQEPPNKKLIKASEDHKLKESGDSPSLLLTIVSELALILT